MKKVETSKVILILSYIAAFILTTIVIIGTFVGVDMSNVTPLALAAWGEVAATNIWYYKKAAKENVLKIAKRLPEEVKNQIDINQFLNS